MIHMRGVGKVYRRGAASVEALRGVDLDIAAGEYVAVVGPSGSGKSTLMNIMGCLDTASAGRYVLAGETVAALDRDRLAAIRNRRVGFVFQGFHLLPYATVLENVELPLSFAGRPAHECRQRAREIVERVGLGDRAHHRPCELSGGQMQRAAIARALVNRPDVVLADEPTGNLDSASGRVVIDLLGELQAAGQTIVVITHDPSLAAVGSRVVSIHDGRIVEDRAA
jgi:putative ABC transport system ATP-binding protein